jgi:hypothetical protein
LSNVTVHPASVRTRIPNSDAIDRSGIMCPVSTVGSPSSLMSHMCVDKTIRPSANATFSGCVVGRLLMTGVPSITKIWVAPESAMASYVSRRNPASPACSVFTRWLSACALNDCHERFLDNTLEMITVSSSSVSSTSADKHTLMGYDECC